MMNRPIQSAGATASLPGSRSEPIASLSRMFHTSVVRTLPVAVTLLLSLGLVGCAKDEDGLDLATSSAPIKSAHAATQADEEPRAVQVDEAPRVMTAEEKRKFDARISPELKNSADYMRRREKQGILTVEESVRLWKIGAYLQAKYAVPDEDVDFVLRLIERGPLVDTDRNRVSLRMWSISSLLPGRGLTEAQQRRAIKVIAPIANDPPKEKISYDDGVRSSELSIQLTAITFLASTRHPEALAILRALRKTTQVKEARERIDEYLAAHATKTKEGNNSIW